MAIFKIKIPDNKICKITKTYKHAIYRKQHKPGWNRKNLSNDRCYAEIVPIPL